MTQPLAALIQTYLPELAGMDVALLGEGSDHRVYQVGTWLLRVPRHLEAGASLESEARVLRWLEPQLPLPVPAYEIAGPGFVGYRKLPGTPALSSPMNARALGPRLGTFLRALHGTDTDTAAALGVPPDDDPELMQWAGAARIDLEYAALHGLLTPDFQTVVRQRLNAPPARSPLPPRPIHGDFAAEHVLLNNVGDPCGVIDWSDMRLGDVAQDLGGLLHWGGPELLAAVQHIYGSLDDATVGRAQFYALCRALADLVFGHSGGRLGYVRAGQRALGWLIPEA